MLSRRPADAWKVIETLEISWRLLISAGRAILLSSATSTEHRIDCKARLVDKCEYGHDPDCKVSAPERERPADLPAQASLHANWDATHHSRKAFASRRGGSHSSTGSSRPAMLCESTMSTRAGVSLRPASLRSSLQVPMSCQMPTTLDSEKSAGRTPRPAPQSKRSLIIRCTEMT